MWIYFILFLNHPVLVSLPLCLPSSRHLHLCTQLLDSLTPMTSSERFSISSGSKRDQAGTSLSSLGHKGVMACNRPSAPTERHLLLFALTARCPFTYPLPSST